MNLHELIRAFTDAGIPIEQERCGTQTVVWVALDDTPDDDAYAFGPFHTHNGLVVIDDEPVASGVAVDYRVDPTDNPAHLVSLIKALRHNTTRTG